MKTKESVPNKFPKILLAIVSALLIFCSHSTRIGFAKRSRPLTQVQSTTAVYVANDQAACKNYSPCYINNEEDGPNGVGTGLKAANEAVAGHENAIIYILGPYAIKSHEVLLSNPATIIGLQGGSLSADSATCTEAMLGLEAAITLRDLQINDGRSCALQSRNLIRVNSPADVLIEHNSLQNGAIAILQQDNSGNLTVQFNSISFNSDFAIKQEAQSHTGTISILGNSIIGNRSPIQVHCAGSGSADHNFWGPGILPEIASAGCTVSDAKRLGAEPMAETSGVAGRKLELSNNFSDPIFGGLSAKSSQVGDVLYVINHAKATPFGEELSEQISACSSYYDIFTGPATQGTISIRFPYSRSDSCALAIESNTYCNAGTPRTPLLWFNPSDPGSRTYIPVSDMTDHESTGQEVLCDLPNKALIAILDASGHPNPTDELAFTPFVVGFTRPVLYNFKGERTKADQNSLQWSTRFEPNISGFLVLRSEKAEGPFLQCSAFIPLNGGVDRGSSYSHNDQIPKENPVFFYQLQVIGLDGSVQQNLGPIEVRLLPPTPTFTKTPTKTPMPYPTDAYTYRRTSTVPATAVKDNYSHMLTETAQAFTLATTQAYISPTPTDTPMPTLTPTKRVPPEWPTPGPQDEIPLQASSRYRGRGLVWIGAGLLLLLGLSTALIVYKKRN